MSRGDKKKQIKLGIVISLIILLAIVITIGSIIITKNMEINEILYSTTYYFGLGSRRVKIYKNGEIYDDVEIENPNHKPNYKYLKTLDTDEVTDLIYEIKNESSSEKIREYVIQLVYGVEEFDYFGRY